MEDGKTPSVHKHILDFTDHHVSDPAALEVFREKKQALQKAYCQCHGAQLATANLNAQVGHSSISIDPALEAGSSSVPMDSALEAHPSSILINPALQSRPLSAPPAPRLVYLLDFSLPSLLWSDSLILLSLVSVEFKFLSLPQSLNGLWDSGQFLLLWNRIM
ncbi:hypothetical protein JVT61DRAFT_6264 [Boletus reticuloceps]|uniref:Uncharacterized protein n=1 Tax=Boletus reticuloceps TaxID=495285 RepID=A0A8I2YJQ1_9AGAM|nr:hypothetical protein JVT61DRAFT_6264 [Boletus reticuloceps]